jgi:hypothetical protein
MVNLEKSYRMTIEKQANVVNPATPRQTPVAKTTAPRVYQSLTWAFNHHMIGHPIALLHEEQFS